MLSEQMSTKVELLLHVDDKSLPLASVGPTFCILKQQESIHSTNAVVEVIIDGSSRSYHVQIESKNSEFIYFQTTTS